MGRRKSKILAQNLQIQLRVQHNIEVNLRTVSRDLRKLNLRVHKWPE